MPSAEIRYIRSKPHATESIRAEREGREKLIEHTAYVVHERRHLMADKDAYQAEMIEHTSRDVLEKRDWLIAQMLVDSKESLDALHKSHEALLAEKRGEPVEVYNAAYDTRATKTA